MHDIEIRFAVFVEVSCLNSWSSAVTTVFVQKGKDLHLDVNKPVVLVKDTEFKWTVNTARNVVRLFPDNITRIVEPYKGRVEFSVQNHSLLLTNVQHNDSGDYTALITGEKNQPVAEYQVIIQDPVSPVQLSVNSVSNSRESCNLTVTCSTEDSLISSTFRCDNQTCHQEGGEQSEVTTSGSSLRVYLLNDFIICNHSNQVSWTRDIKEIQSLCSRTAESCSQSISLCLVKTVVFSVGLIIMVSAVISVHLMERLKK
ncbi:SLAM family member 5-like [Scomber japonicus]|uniref:SLAM family member 5-like n=1 Tax=Scomber japonicus TaxID=13676 RepID=UPI002305B39E|nr:SLAM family member 5-like [Scomber japonicus]